MYNEIITYYSKNPFNKFEMQDYSVSLSADNDVCGDELEIFLKIENNIVKNWSFVWDTALITTACWSAFWESIVWMNISEVLDLDYKYLVSIVQEEISDRRKKASVLWILATRNAIHKYLWDWIKDDFDDVLPN